MNTPGVYYSQRDLSQVVQGLDSTILGIAGNAKWGPTDKLVQITGLGRYTQLFGKPINPTVSPVFYQLYQFFKLASVAYYVRPQGGSLYGGIEALKAAEPIAVAAGLEALPLTPSGSNVVGIYTKYAGVHEEGGIFINITEVDATAGTFNLAVGFLSDDVIDTSNPWYEEHSVSVIRGAKDDSGRSLYITDVLERDSQLIAGAAKTNALVDDLPSVTASPVEITKNAYVEASEADVMAAYELFRPLSAVTIDFIIPSVFTAKVINKTADIAISRGDCFYIATPAVEFAGWTAVDAESQLVGSAGWLSTITRSWAGAAYAMYYKMKDEYNDTTVDVPAAGLIAGAYAYSDAQSAQWFAPAGPKRGIQPGVELGKIWNQGQTDVLYLGGMNWVQNTPRYGNTLEGQKTLYGANSALSRVNVARLMLKLRRDLTSFLQDFVYELNNERNRLLAYNGVDSYLREIRSREGLTDYRVVCDETNNPPSVIDQNKLNLDIYVKPPKVAEFLYLRSTIASSGVDFSTIIQQA